MDDREGDLMPLQMLYGEMHKLRETARDLSKRLEKAHEKIAQLEEDNQLLRRKIENHIIMSEDFHRSYDEWLDFLNVEVK